MKLSIRQRLLLLMLTAMTVVWLGAALLTWRDAHHELSEVLDAHLAQASVLLVVQFSHELDDLDEENYDLGAMAGAHRYAKQIAFQVWEDGDELVLRSRNAPHTALAGPRSGFSDHRHSRRALAGIQQLES
ncbi:MAG: sensor histidine kinase N-terminal domain-containing protein [Thiolinea sp.]